MQKLNKNIFLFCSVIIGLATGLQAQITVTKAKDMSVSVLLDSMFLGEGVALDTTYPARFNGKTTIASNQIGIFSNTDTTAADKNVPILEGIVITTCEATSKVGSGGNVSPASDNAPDLASMLNYDYEDYCEENTWITKSKLNDVGCLDFWVIPSTDKMSFRYSFGSAEYPKYVCSPYNDIFGLYVDGPYESDASYEPYTGSEGKSYSNVNIAVVPGTGEEGVVGSGDKVMINTINGGTTNSHCSQYNDNKKYFIDNSVGKENTGTGLGGYTVRLTTDTVDVIPCKTYHIQIAIANASDHSLNSAVFLEKGSFSGKMVSIGHETTITNDAMETHFVRGCSSDTMIVRANYVVSEQDPPYFLTIKPTAGSNIQKGVDYTVTNIETGDDISDKVSIAPGDSVVRMLLEFKGNPDKKPGDTDTLMFISEDKSSYSCIAMDTIYYVMIAPDSMQCKVTGGATYCEDKLPQMDTINIQVENALSYTAVTLSRGWGENEVIVEKDTFRYEPGQLTRIVNDTFQIPILSMGDTSACHITIEDSCFRKWDTVIYYSVMGTSTKASVTNDYICEGDTVTLSCPPTTYYEWLSYPPDSSLTFGGNNTSREVRVWPKRTTTYFLTATSDAGCVAQDTLTVKVEPRVIPKISLLPKDVKYSDPVVQYADLTVDAYAREWFFGDGDSSDYQTGYHSYPVISEEDSHTYVVTLIAYNKAMCSDTTYDSVTLKADFTFYVPNAFVPGSERGGEIATFGPKGSLLGDWELFIYNRWGTKLYHGVNQPWDGKLEDGSWAPQGTYVYDIYYKDDKGRGQRYTGVVNALPAKGNDK